MQDSEITMVRKWKEVALGIDDLIGFKDIRKRMVWVSVCAYICCICIYLCVSMDMVGHVGKD